MGWAFVQPVKSQAERLVLLALADSADKNTNQCWPSHKHLADDAMCSVATVKRALKALEGYGYVRKTPRFSDNEQRSNLYELLIAPPVHCEPPVHNSDPTPVHNSDPTPVHNSELPPRSPDELQNRQLTVSEPSINRQGRATKRCPSDWQPRQQDIDTLLAEFPHLTLDDIRRSGRVMVDYEFKTARKDWNAVFRNWIRRDAERKRPRQTFEQQKVGNTKSAMQEFLDG